MRKFAVLCLTAALIFTNITYGYAEDTAAGGRIAFSNAEAEAGEIIEICCSLHENSGITTLDFHLKYDKTALELISVSNCNLLGSFMGSEDIKDNPYYLGWINSLQQENCTQSGNLAVMKFRIKDSAQKGNYFISIEEKTISAYDANLNEICFSVKAGIVTVRKQEESKSQSNTIPSEEDKDMNADAPEVNPLIQKFENMKIKIISCKYSKEKKQVTLKYKKSNSKIKCPQYQIWRSTKKNSGYKKIYTTKKTTFINKSLSKNVNSYYYKVRGIRKFDGETHYTQWSQKVKVTIKK